jgi:hypothetical protein
MSFKKEQWHCEYILRPRVQGQWVKPFHYKVISRMKICFIFIWCILFSEHKRLIYSLVHTVYECGIFKAGKTCWRQQHSYYPSTLCLIHLWNDTSCLLETHIQLIPKYFPHCRDLSPTHHEHRFCVSNPFPHPTYSSFDSLYLFIWQYWVLNPGPCIC